jgi:hypothetical protein
MPMAPMVPLPELPEEINEVAVDVEREEDEGGAIGDTFMDYVRFLLSQKHVVNWRVVPCTF